MILIRDPDSKSKQKLTNKPKITFVLKTLKNGQKSVNKNILGQSRDLLILENSNVVMYQCFII